MWWMCLRGFLCWWKIHEEINLIKFIFRTAWTWNVWISFAFPRVHFHALFSQIQFMCAIVMRTMFDSSNCVIGCGIWCDHCEWLASSTSNSNSMPALLYFFSLLSFASQIVFSSSNCSTLSFISFHRQFSRICVCVCVCKFASNYFSNSIW